MLIDRLIVEFDHALRVVAPAAKLGAEHPGSGAQEVSLGDAEREESIRLMRVNHAGEVSAQALYQGQLVFANDDATRAALTRARDEEQAHLYWCEARLEELGGSTSVLNPFWYAGSFAIGAVAARVSDRISLGFLEETEAQVEAHLTDHLERLPESDQRSRLILERMREDEIRHGSTAAALGAAVLPRFVKRAMQAVSRVMTRTAYYV